jgi:hypothetical protein
VGARKRPNLVAVAFPVAVAVPVVALGFMFVSAHGKVSDSQSQLDAIRAEIDALPMPRGPVIDASLQGEQVQRAQAVANVLGSRVPWDAVLRDVSRVLPENVWLTSLQAQVAATAAVGTTAAAATASATPGVPSTPTGALIGGFTTPSPTSPPARPARDAADAHQRDPHVEQGRGEGEDADRPLPDRCRPEHRRFLMNGLLQQKKAVAVLGAVGAVALLAAAWFLVVAPKQSKADDLDRQVTAAQSELPSARSRSPPVRADHRQGR